MELTNELKLRMDKVYQENRSEVQQQLEQAVSYNYSRVKSRLCKLAPVKIYYPGQLMSIEEINQNILALLQPTIIALATEDNIVGNFVSDITTEYYDTLVKPQINNITYALFSMTSDYIIGMLLYYMNKEFIFSYIANTIVRPNVSTVVDNVKLILNRKNVIDEELKATEKFNELLSDLVDSFMIELNIDKFQEKLTTILTFDVKDKLNKIISFFDSSKYFVPDVLYSIVTSGTATDTDIERATRFIERYMISHSDTAVQELFSHYNKKDNSLTPELIQYTVMERNAYHNVTSLQMLDGLNFVENKIANRIITFTTAEADTEFIEKSEILKNIKSVVDKFHKYDTVISLSGNDVIMKHPNGEVKTYNIRKEGLSNIINDPFIVFSKPEFIKHVFFNRKSACALYQTGITKEEDSNLLLNNRLRNIDNKSPEERVAHRRLQIQKLLAECKNNEETMKEYQRITSQKITEIKYINQLQHNKYVMADKHKLLLTLAETDALYNQILVETAANAKSKIIQGGN